LRPCGGNKRVAPWRRGRIIPCGASPSDSSASLRPDGALARDGIIKGATAGRPEIAANTEAVAAFPEPRRPEVCGPAGEKAQSETADKKTPA